MGSNSSSPRTVQEIFNDFSARRNAIVRALTNEVDQFFSLCDPEKDHVCLYGHPNESWEVTVPAEEVPPELPEPVLGINVDRNEINRRVWLSIVAAHSDSWLLSVAFFFGSQLNRNERECLFSLMNDLPTVLEVVTGRKPIKDKPTTDSGHKSKSSSKVKAFQIAWIYIFCETFQFLTTFDNIQRSNDGQIRSYAKLLEESKGEDDEEYNKNICGSCGGYYNPDEFWICCDICDRWFHGECVKITPAMAESIMLYKCPSCNTKELGNRD